MIQEYANCFDLQCLLDQRSSLGQEEARIIVCQIAKGVQHLASLKILHRDLKPANIMLHFPDIPNFERLSSSEKLMFLKNVDLKRTNFSVKIADFGLSTVLDPRSSVLSIVGTPLYQAPQVLAQVYYDDSIDTWALGTILYELLHGVTPFHCPDEEQLMNKMKEGRYKVRSNGEPISIEACLFLLECLQIHEEDRIDVDLLLSSPFINEALSGVKLHELDHATFTQELQAENAKQEDCDSSDESIESPLTRNTEKLTCSENEIDLTIKPSLMREVLVR